jgi:hypothetical protein
MVGVGQGLKKSVFSRLFATQIEAKPLGQKLFPASLRGLTSVA